jgi:AcrR family transcriptional regulator
MEILACTMDLVRGGGLGALTTRRIAEKVGFTEAALYRHFPSKQALILGMMDRLDEMLLGPIEDIALDESASVVQRIERIVRHHTDIIRRHKSLPILLLAEASVSEDEELLARMRLIFKRYLTVMEDLVRRGQAESGIVSGPEPDCLALLLLGAPAALAIRHRLLPDFEAEDRFAETLIPFLVSVIRVDEGN